MFQSPSLHFFFLLSSSLFRMASQLLVLLCFLQSLACGLEVVGITSESVLLLCGDPLGLLIVVVEACWGAGGTKREAVRKQREVDERKAGGGYLEVVEGKFGSG
ncbi:hypothetical protein OIU79_001707 [Salix purpurea]|uniref:Uncharacterized protein n=1 Tax=Salix purpurea TaxID=77065 RepID=A0A9Q0UQU3_SALPP|nr:hypothetical protein OIU79_001707 [Salix purpurea]